MKFGRNLARNQVPEWATYYIKYKALKKLIKSAAETAKHGEATDTAGKHAGDKYVWTQTYCLQNSFSRSTEI